MDKNVQKIAQGLRYYFGGICTLFKYNLNWLLVLLLDYISEEFFLLFTA